jgi:NAD(P)-dependent dehydrogenase (short-subunit alcohol dehydrogenase family)
MERQKELDLAGKVVAITGASRGIGRQAALDFARRGASVVLAARTVDRIDDLPGTLGDALNQIEAMGGQAIAVQTDLARQEDLHRLVDAAVEAFGGIDILVNNAAATVGPMWDKRFLDLSFEEWSYQFDVNLHAPFILMQRIVPIMEKRGGGRIINITTGSGEVLRLPEEPVKGDNVQGKNLIVPGYYASKRALDRLSSVIAPELASKNIFVISMMPGWVATEIVAARFEETPAELKTGQQPVPMEIPARMTVYFAACDNPREYNGRIFWAEREMADMGITAD